MLKTARHMDDEDPKKRFILRPFHSHPENTSIERPIRQLETYTLKNYYPKSTYSSN